MATQLKRADEAMAVDEFLADLRSFLKQHHPGDSKIVKAIANGTASKKAVRNFAKEICAVSAISLRPFAALVSNAPDETSYQLTLENFASEAGLLDSPPHPVLFRRFTLAAGVTEEELESHIPLPSTLGAMYALDRFLRGPFDEAVTGFGFAIEGPAAEWGPLVLEGLRSHYELDDEAIKFWILHFERDEEGAALEEQHAKNARVLMERFAATREQQARLRKTYMHSVLIFENLFTGMEQFLDDE